VSSLIEKLSDGGNRVRDGAKKGLEMLAGSPSVGPQVVTSHAMRPMNAKQKAAWRPLLSRLELLTDIITQYGVGAHTGLSMDSAMNFAKGLSAFTHSNVEVREATKAMTVALQKIYGTAALDSYLSLLRPKQKEEYLAAFDSGGSKDDMGQRRANGTGHGHGNAAAAAGGGGGGVSASSSSERSSHNHVTHSPGGKVQTSAEKSSNKGVSGGDHVDNR
jgi:hypothetical protein